MPTEFRPVRVAPPRLHRQPFASKAQYAKQKTRRALKLVTHPARHDDERVKDVPVVLEKAAHSCCVRGAAPEASVSRACCCRRGSSCAGCHPKPHGFFQAQGSKPCRKPCRTSRGDTKPCVLPPSRLAFTLNAGPCVNGCVKRSKVESAACRTACQPLDQHLHGEQVREHVHYMVQPRVVPSRRYSTAY